MTLMTMLYFDNDDRDTFFVFPKCVGTARRRAQTGNDCDRDVTRQGVLLMWPVSPTDTGLNDGWQKSSREAASLAKSRWTRMASDMSLGAYRIHVAQGELPDPEWPEKSLSELLEIAFRDRVIDSEDHPACKAT